MSRGGDAGLRFRGSWFQTRSNFLQAAASQRVVYYEEVPAASAQCTTLFPLFFFFWLHFNGKLKVSPEV